MLAIGTSAASGVASPVPKTNSIAAAHGMTKAIALTPARNATATTTAAIGPMSQMDAGLKTDSHFGSNVSFLGNDMI